MKFPGIKPGEGETDNLEMKEADRVGSVSLFEGGCMAAGVSKDLLTLAVISVC